MSGAAISVAVRADASVQIGTGHVMRCLTLAEALRERGATVTFVCREHPGHLCGLVESRGYRTLRLPRPDATLNSGSLAHSHWLGVSQADDVRETRAALGAGERLDWLIVDHYALDASWETPMRSHAKRIMAVDDLADRKHDCDVLLDQNYHHPLSLEPRYDELVPAGCKRLLGLRYALLRKEFGESRARLRKRDGAVRRVLVFFGGADSTNETAKTIEALVALKRPGLEVDVVVGVANPRANEISALCAAVSNFHFHDQVGNMADAMAVADLGIGAAGVAMWERCCLGLPAIVLSVADNQRPGSKSVAHAGGILYLGDSSDVTMHALSSAINFMCSSPFTLMDMSEVALGLLDARGALRVARRLVERPVKLRRATATDCESVYLWRNDAETRRYSGDGAVISRGNHERWFASALADPGLALLIGEIDGRPVGVIRFDADGERAVASAYLVPGNKGGGFGSVLIEQGVRWVRANWPDVRFVDAQIQPANTASIAAFEEAGFRKSHHIYSKSVGT